MYKNVEMKHREIWDTQTFIVVWSLDLHPLLRVSTLLVPLFDVTTKVQLQSHTQPIF